MESTPSRSLCESKFCISSYLIVYTLLNKAHLLSPETGPSELISVLLPRSSTTSRHKRRTHRALRRHSRTIMSGTGPRESIFPTRMALTNTKTRLKGAQTGHSLLAKKRDALTTRFRAILRKVDEVRSRRCPTMNYSRANCKIKGETEDGPRDAARFLLPRRGHLCHGRHRLSSTGAG
jgi:ATP synthase subunit D